ncbi:pyridine nucleotide-disulfide oxidoreductase [Streptomyces sp. NPDC040750]|uniref:pyridine nucleotide-disulfide oxidoreductase n=1 Tax=Streptomyces sp. NPDC040750 TaxID=3154491 RepID=UPI0033D5B6F8
MSASATGPTTARDRRRAVVIGGGLTGMLAARALAGEAHVTVVERDTLPDAPGPRKGLPQAHHVHLLWSGGADAIEALLPGTGDALAARGARRIPLTTGMVAYSPQGWFRRWDESHYVIGCSRDLLDWVVRRQVLADPRGRVTVLPRTEVLGLEGDARAVTGVRVRRTGAGTEVLRADLVVDASGRASRTPHWLRELGGPEPASREVDPGLVYASRIYPAPEKTHHMAWPIVNVQALGRGSGPGQAGVILPIEDGRWLVTLSGTTGGEPTGANDDFLPFALRLRHPVVGELIERLTPLTDVTVTRTTVNRRRYYEKAPMPRGLVVLGDAVAAYNPVYGHGMSVAALSALTLRDTVRRHGWAAAGLSRRVQKGIASHVGTAWTLATGSDVFYPDSTEHGPTLGERVAARFVDRLLYTATGSGRIARDVTDVMTLEAGPHRLARPSTVVAAIRGPLKPQLAQPPFTDEERQALAAS